MFAGARLGWMGYLGEARLVLMGLILKRFFWLWVFLVNFSSGLVAVKG